MPEFLSDEWLTALDDCARALGPIGDIAPFVLEQVVTDDADASVRRYRLVFTDGGVRVEPGDTNDDDADEADVTFVTERATAAAIAQGATNAQHALAAGRLRVRGDVGALVARAGAFAALEDAFAAVRGATTYR